MFATGQKIRCVDNSNLGTWGQLTFGNMYEVLELLDFDPVVIDDKGEKKWFSATRFVADTPANIDYLSACEALPFPAPVKGDDGAVYDYDGRKCEVKREEVGTRWITVHDKPFSDSDYFVAGHAWPHPPRATDPNNKTYVLYDFPTDANGVVLDPVKLSQLGYTVEPEDGYESKPSPQFGWSLKGSIHAWGIFFKDALSAWQGAAQHHIQSKGNK